MAQNEKILQKFVGDQLSCWPLACNNFRALKAVETKDLEVGGLKVKAQFNPARMISSAAKLSKEDIAARKCFLCRENRPPEQLMLKFEGRKGKKYDILVNPYPIFQEHLVIANSSHTPQTIWKRYVDILDLSKKYQGYLFFYNGPKSGASAPDHHHFQGIPKGQTPLEVEINAQFAGDGEALAHIVSLMDARLYRYCKFCNGVFVIASDTVKSAAKLLYRLLDCQDIPKGESEPLFNLFAYFKGGQYYTIVVFRTRHRSHHYFSEGPDHLTMSPGCIDMAGVFVCPVGEEFKKLDSRLLSEVVAEVTLSEAEQNKIIDRLTRTQRKVEVGIVSGEEIDFEILSDGAGVRKAKYTEGKIEYDGALFDELYFEEPNPSTRFAQESFRLDNVVIGKEFHWQRNERQVFAGALKIIVSDKRLVAVNVIGVEDYLLSVISSEMNAAASLEFLKAHAVISRSWLMSKILRAPCCQKTAAPEISSEAQLATWLAASANADGKADGNGTLEYVKWYDHEEHKDFDVCADDHCQRYQGLGRVVGENVKKAVDETWGQVLTYEGEICDARFSKCCGGMTEKYSTCWEDKDYAYLPALADTPEHGEGRCFCDTDDEAVLSQVLNSYDLETKDFYRWKVVYDRAELSALVKEKSACDLGEITAIAALERGGSGRISKLRITGSKQSLIVGKELEIRKLLSTSHLKSSAFDVTFDGDKVIFDGKGWGHGVGLCQIGAAVMASLGYDYRRILEHYYPGTIVCHHETE